MSPSPLILVVPALGEARVALRLRASPTDEHYEELELTVDTGSTYSWIPRAVLERLGVEPTRRGRFRTMEGRVVERDIGHVFVEYGGEVAPTTVVFAEPGDACVMGLHALEALGLEVDPTTGRVRKSEALMAF